MTLLLLFKTDHNHMKICAALLMYFPINLSFSCPCISESPSGKWEVVKRCSWLTSNNARRCRMLFSFLVLFHYSHIMKAASVTQRSVVCEHWCHIRTNHSVYSHDEKLICLSVWTCWPRVSDTVMKWDEEMPGETDRVTERGRTTEVNM